MRTILAVIGDYYHPETNIKDALDKAIEVMATRGELTIRYTTVDRLAEELEKGPSTVVLFKEDRINPNDEQVRLWMTEETEQAIVRFVENGGGWLAWHSGLASYRTDGAYTAMLRGYFISHPDKHQIVSYTAVADASGPLSQNGSTNKLPFDILDEHYFVHCDEEATSVFLRSASIDGKSIAGWSHEYGSGRVCCLAPAHNREGLLHPGMLQVLKNCVRWSSGM